MARDYDEEARVRQTIGRQEMDAVEWDQVTAALRLGSACLSDVATFGRRRGGESTVAGWFTTRARRTAKVLEDVQTGVHGWWGYTFATAADDLRLAARIAPEYARELRLAAKRLDAVERAIRDWEGPIWREDERRRNAERLAKARLWWRQERHARSKRSLRLIEAG